MADGSVRLHDAETASAIPRVNAAMARAVAVRSYRGKSAPPSVRAVTSASTEYKGVLPARSEEHTSELQSLMRISYAVFCLKKKTQSNALQCSCTQMYET